MAVNIEHTHKVYTSRNVVLWCFTFSCLNAMISDKANEYRVGYNYESEHRIEGEGRDRGLLEGKQETQGSMIFVFFLLFLLHIMDESVLEFVFLIRITLAFSKC